jgi:soluble lytic murein transglycosylase-like protein
MADHPRRRAEDRETSKSERPAGQPTEKPRYRRRARDFFQRFRQPLIGLGLAGAAAPMVRTTKAEEAKAEEAPDAAAADAATASEAKSADLEDRIASQIAEATVDEDRERSVSSAVSRYGIARELAEDIHDIAIEAGIDPAMAFGLVKTESTFDPRAVSHVGALGLTQVMPRTARWLMPGTKAEDLYDRQTNLRLGFRYLSQLIDKYRGDVRLALTAYNRGPGTVDRVLKRGGNPDNGYADKVLGG